MTLPNSGTIVAADLNSEMEGARASLEADTQEAWARSLDSITVFGLDSATVIDDRSRIFQVDDVVRLEALRLEVEGHASTTITTTVTLEAIGADESADPAATEYRTPSAAVTTSSSTKVVAGTEYVTPTGDLFFLRPGVDYRLALSSNHADPSIRVVGHLVMGSKRSQR